MHDIRLIRETPHAFDAGLARRGVNEAPADLYPIYWRANYDDGSTPPENTSGWSPSELVLKVDEDRREAIASAEYERASQNVLSREAADAKRRGDEAEFARFQRGSLEVRERFKQEDARASRLKNALDEILRRLPNLPDDDVPDGPDETANVELRRWGAPRNFDFRPLEHYRIPAAVPGLDFEGAGRLVGGRFVVLRGAMARVHRALAQFMLDFHVEKHELEELWTPVLVRTTAMEGTGQLPKFANDSFETSNGWWLIPTGEVTLTNLVAGLILDARTLPQRMTAHTQCFRSEAGSAGKDTAGMLRQHQFEKVEMVSITRPEDSRAELDRMTGCAEAVLQALGLPYRTIVLATGDMGFGAQRTHDIEVWLPGQDAYREISSCSVCGDFQARRMNARFRRGEGAKPEFVHTLNGSGLAVGRCLIAVLENGQQADGSVTLPAALHPYLRGATRIDPEGRLI